MSDWKFDLDEVGSEGVSETEGDGEREGDGQRPDEDEQAEEAEEEIWLPPIEPGHPDLENVVPFLIGIGMALFIFLKFL